MSKHENFKNGIWKASVRHEMQNQTNQKCKRDSGYVHGSFFYHRVCPNNPAPFTDGWQMVFMQIYA